MLVECKIIIIILVLHACALLAIYHLISKYSLRNDFKYLQKQVQINHAVCITDIVTSWWALSSSTTTPTSHSSTSTPTASNRGNISWIATWIEPVGGRFSWLRVNSCWRGSFWWCWWFVWYSVIARIFCGTFSSFKIQGYPFLTTTYKSVENNIINKNGISILQSCNRLICFNSKFQVISDYSYLTITNGELTSRLSGKMRKNKQKNICLGALTYCSHKSVSLLIQNY